MKPGERVGRALGNRLGLGRELIISLRFLLGSMLGKELGVLLRLLDGLPEGKLNGWKLQK